MPIDEEADEASSPCDGKGCGKRIGVIHEPPMGIGGGGGGGGGVRFVGCVLHVSKLTQNPCYTIPFLVFFSVQNHLSVHTLARAPSHTHMRVVIQ